MAPEHRNIVNKTTTTGKKNQHHYIKSWLGTKLVTIKGVISNTRFNEVRKF